MKILKKKENEDFIRALQEFVKKWNNPGQVDFAITYLNNLKIELTIKGALAEHIEECH